MLASASSKTDLYFRTMLMVAAIAGVTHAVFLLLFWHIGVAELARLNVLSVLTYVVAGLLLSRWPVFGTFLMGVEIVVHGLVAACVMGWDSGFHFYIILILPLIIVNPCFSAALKAGIVLSVGGLYVVLDAKMRGMASLHPVPEQVLNGLHTFNLTGMLVILGLLAAVYYQLILRAESVLRHQACSDPLTRLHNRRFIMEVAEHEAAVFARQGRPLSFILGDVDHFKAINDRHGHQTGDMVLQAVAKVLQAGVRQIDHVARWGGEEFLILLPGTDTGEALAVAERLRASVAAQVCETRKGPVPVTLTLGVATLHQGETVEQAIGRVDQALYKGKEAGRNRVEGA